MHMHITCQYLLFRGTPGIIGSGAQSEPASLPESQCGAPSPGSLQGRTERSTAHKLHMTTREYGK